MIAIVRNGLPSISLAAIYVVRTTKYVLDEILKNLLPLVLEFVNNRVIILILNLTKDLSGQLHLHEY